MQFNDFIRIERSVHKRDAANMIVCTGRNSEQTSQTGEFSTIIPGEKKTALEKI
jgi:hypothetical protein